jgi:N-methylhydantoinase A
MGRLPSAIGGGLVLDSGAARAAFEPLARHLGLSLAELAAGVLAVAEANIERAARRISVARGRDPRHYTLVAFGGAGGLHACAIAERLGMTRVLIPRHPGVLCALGLLLADIQLEQARPVLARATRGVIARLRATQAELLAWGRAELLSEGIPEARQEMLISLDMRYVGQAHELNLPFEGDVVARFHQLHRATYGHAIEGRSVEIVAMRARAVGQSDKPPLRPEALGSSEPRQAFIGTSPTPQGELRLYDRERLRPGMVISGGALVVQADSTSYLPPSWTAQVDGYGSLLAQHQP